jgi:Family of unknown function (DUF6132)
VDAAGANAAEEDGIMSIFIPVLVGAGLGALMGYYGQCSSGTCPLTSTWWRGAIYGAVLGLVFSQGGSR